LLGDRKFISTVKNPTKQSRKVFPYVERLMVLSNLGNVKEIPFFSREFPITLDFRLISAFDAVLRQNVPVERLCEVAEAIAKNTHLEKLHLANTRATDKVANVCI